MRTHACTSLNAHADARAPVGACALLSLEELELAARPLLLRAVLEPQRRRRLEHLRGGESREVTGGCGGPVRGGESREVTGGCGGPVRRGRDLCVPWWLWLEINQSINCSCHEQVVLTSRLAEFQFSA